MERAEGVDSDVVLGVAERLHILHPAHSGSREACNQENFLKNFLLHCCAIYATFRKQCLLANIRIL